MYSQTIYYVCPYLNSRLVTGLHAGVPFAQTDAHIRRQIIYCYIWSPNEFWQNEVISHWFDEFINILIKSMQLTLWMRRFIHFVSINECWSYYTAQNIYIYLFVCDPDVFIDGDSDGVGDDEDPSKWAFSKHIICGTDYYGVLLRQPVHLYMLTRIRILNIKTLCNESRNVCEDILRVIGAHAFSFSFYN